MASYLLDEATRNKMASVEVFNSAVTALDRSQQWERALHLFGEVFSRRSSIEPDVVSINAALSACASQENGLWQAALNLISGMPAARISIDQVTHNSGITACVKGTAWQIVLHLAGRGSGVGGNIRPDAITYATTTSACDRSTRWQHAFWLEDRCRHCGVTSSSAKSLSYSTTACVGASSRAGRWENALDFLRLSLQSKAEPSIISCSALCAGDGRRWHLALYLASGLGLDSTFYNEILGASDWANAVVLLDQMQTTGPTRPSLQMNAVSCSAAMGSCQRWEHWQECLQLFLVQQLVGINCNLSSFTVPSLAMSKRSKWGALALLLQSVRDQRLEVDSASNLAALLASDWQRSVSLFCQSRESVTGLSDFQNSQFFDNYAEAEWCSASLLLSDLEATRLEGTEMLFSLASAICRKGNWVKALQISRDLSHLGVPYSSRRAPVLNSFCAAVQWPNAVAALQGEPGLLDYDVLVMLCWKCEENVIAAKLLNDSRGLRSPVSFLWGLSVLHEPDPKAIHSACVDVWVAMKETTRPSDFDLITSWRASAALGAYNVKFHQFLAEHVLNRLGGLPLEELSFAVQGAASTTAPASFFCSVQDRVLEILGGDLDLSFYKDGQELLSVIFACKIAGEEVSFVKSSFLKAVRDALHHQGQQLDKQAGTSHRAHHQVDDFEVQLDRPVVMVTGGADRPVLVKPPGWEVYNERVQSCPQLLSFVRRTWPGSPIQQDVGHNFGFLHRLDVPSSGLILLARSYEAFYDLQLQLCSGLMLRDYTVLCHGFVTRNWLDFRLFYQGSGPSRAGRGKVSFSRLSIESRFEVAGLTLTLWRIETGRRHQIRSQAAHVGHCTVRDRVYSSSETFLMDAAICERNWLHRHRVTFQNAQGKSCEVTSELPRDLRSSLAAIKNLF
eukprot:Skav215338  [mRNA]  locus=scaffold1391:212065:214773:- [translate_table: standard]